MARYSNGLPGCLLLPTLNGEYAIVCYRQADSMLHSC